MFTALQATLEEVPMPSESDTVEAAPPYSLSRVATVLEASSEMSFRLAAARLGSAFVGMPSGAVKMGAIGANASFELRPVDCKPSVSLRETRAKLFHILEYQT